MVLLMFMKKVLLNLLTLTHKFVALQMQANRQEHEAQGSTHDSCNLN
jgi:hypothetical protein